MTATIDRIVALRGQQHSLRSIAAAVGVSEFSVQTRPEIADEQGTQEASTLPLQGRARRTEQLTQPVLPALVPRVGERAAARAVLLECAGSVFSPAAHVHHAGLFLALPDLESSELVACAKKVYGSLPNGFYGLEPVLIDAVLRALAGEARAEGATRFDPVELRRVLGIDRAPEVKTIHRMISQLSETGKAEELNAALAKHHLNSTGSGGENLAALLYVDGNVRAYLGCKKIGKLNATLLKFPVPASEETRVTDAHGSPVFVVMAEPGASLAGELRKLLPELLQVVGDERRVLAGFDRCGWSPDLFKHMAEQGFHMLTWREGASKDVEELKRNCSWRSPR
ncbi:putative transposase [Arthrobacter glacialis]|uniref:Uncharacterized protein n=1 Tax=Arthrobacter glacialis TaxID=1664 RepID=A0A2S4A0U5_ARTGL|nr:hypothetical protein [Arthrobacter glacialis]POH74909.1 hypothetical protein CVS27_03340 [Arthrobacter glacialis]